MKDMRSKLHVLPIMTSVIGRRNSSLEHASLRLWKLMQIWIFPFFLATGTILATQSAYCSSLMKCELMSFLTLASMASIIEGRNHHCGCLNGFFSESMWAGAWPPEDPAQACPHNSKRRHQHILVWVLWGLLFRRETDLLRQRWALASCYCLGWFSPLIVCWGFSLIEVYIP